MAQQGASTIFQESRQSKTLTASSSSVSQRGATTFIEKVIARKKKEFRDSNAKENIDKLNQELIDIKNIMHENFDMILNRDKNLSKIS